MKFQIPKLKLMTKKYDIDFDKIRSGFHSQRLLSHSPRNHYQRLRYDYSQKKSLLK